VGRRVRMRRLMLDFTQAQLAAGADAVGALFVLLDLLEGQSQSASIALCSLFTDAPWVPTALISEQTSVQLLRQCGASAHTEANCGPNQWARWLRMAGHPCRKDCSMEYAVTAAFLLSVVAGSFAAVILGGYGIAQLIASAL
jgi:hypothetical protein